jgi:hypothetical protein
LIPAETLADSLANAAPMSRAWPGFLEGWHDFFIVAGTAAATLAALLFVAIALHVETLVADMREHLLGLARAILFSFIVVLLLSLMMLVPGMPRRVTAVQLIVLGAVSLFVTVRQLRGQRATDHTHFSLGLFRRRLMLPLVGYVWVMLTGVGMLAFNPAFFDWMVGAVCMLLGNATGTSWDLLVRVARIKRADAEQKADVG